MSRPAAAEEDYAQSWERPLSNSWMLREMRGKVSGAFGLCAIETIYEAATESQRKQLRSRSVMLSIMYGGLDKIGVSIAGESWSITEGRNYQVRFTFDDGNSFTAQGVGVTTIGMNVVVGLNKNWLQRMMMARAFDLEINGKDVARLRLNGSANAIKELFACAFAGRGENGVAGDTFGDTFGDSKPANDTF